MIIHRLKSDHDTRDHHWDYDWAVCEIPGHSRPSGTGGSGEPHKFNKDYSSPWSINIWSDVCLSLTFLSQVYIPFSPLPPLFHLTISPFIHSPHSWTGCGADNVWVSEADGSLEVCAVVNNGTVVNPVTISVSLSRVSATGKCSYTFSSTAAEHTYNNSS